MSETAVNPKIDFRRRLDSRLKHKTANAVFSKLTLALKIALVLVFSLAFLELSSRAIHTFKAPLLPYYFEDGATMLPANADLNVSFLRGVTTRYVTDAWGARIGERPAAAQGPKEGVFVIGDSQMLGYSIDFRDTFASKLAFALTGDANAARILAAPASHPGTFAPSLQKYARSKPERQKLMIVGLNLGNDLDELYDEGISVTHENDPLNKWLLPRSYIYMDMVLVRSRWLRPGDYPIGVNPIFYMLNSQERVILAREAVRILDGLLTDPKIEADHKVLVIIPADVQLDPAVFLKYRRYYSSDVAFDKWNQQAFALAGTMNAIEEYLARQFEQRGYRVIRLSKLVTQENQSVELFDSTSHHLTSTAHALLASAILKDLH